MMRVFLAIVPALFVIIWSTGFISARMTAPYAPVLLTLMFRFAAAAAIFAIWAYAVKAVWPKRRQVKNALIIGALLHGTYLSGVFIAIKLGLPSAPAALIVGLQPLLTTIFSVKLGGDPASPRQWLGVILGFVGVTLVLWPKLSVAGEGWPVLGVAFAVGSLVAITLATSLQKRLGSDGNKRAANVFQNIGGLMVVTPLVVFMGDFSVDWTGEYVVGLLWMTVVLSIGSITLYQFLLERGSLVNIVSLFYLVPVSTAIIAYFMFGDTLELLQLFAMGIAVIGVLLATSNTPKHPEPVERG